MSSDENSGSFDDRLLPYRMTAADLARWLEARARGRSSGQIRALFSSPKAYEGTLAGAAALGLVHSGTGELTNAGQAYALASADARPALLREAMLRYEPYGLLLEAAVGRDRGGTTELEWIEAWWATQGWGASVTNRAEGSTVFARLVDQVGLGSYVQGRRGHPSRIQWDAAMRIPAVGDRPAAVHTAHEPVPSVSPPPVPAAQPRELAQDPGKHTSVTLEFSGGERASFSIPGTLKRADKQRLLDVVNTLVRVSPEED